MCPFIFERALPCIARIVRGGREVSAVGICRNYSRDNLHLSSILQKEKESVWVRVFHCQFSYPRTIVMGYSFPLFLSLFALFTLDFPAGSVACITLSRKITIRMERSRFRIKMIRMIQIGFAENAGNTIDLTWYLFADETFCGQEPPIVLYNCIILGWRI